MSSSILDFEEIIQNYNTLSENKIDIAHRFSSDIKRQKNYVIGVNQYSDLLIDTFDVDAVINDYIQDLSEWKGKPIIRSCDVEEGSIVINCSMSISPVTVNKVLDSLNNVYSIHYSDLCRYSSDLSFPDFVNEARKDLIKNKNSYKNIFSLFLDDASRLVFNDLLAYRLTADPSYMDDYSVRVKDQYFEAFLGDLDNAIFVDCGGFDGDTTEEFCQRYKNYKKIYVFEPSMFNFSNAESRLKKYRDIELIPEGLSDSIGFLQFNSDVGSASCINEAGSTRIKVTTLDDKITEIVTFIKMDLEGWEIKALQGSVNHIKNDRPILAISVYHHISDFWNVPEFILNINMDYDIYLRHYTEGWSETIMYFVPK